MELSMRNVDALTSSAFLHREMHCTCGKTHFMDVDKVLIEEQALNKLVPLLQEYGTKKPLVIMDKNTKAAAGKKVFALLEAAAFPYSVFCFNTPKSLVPDEYALGAVLSKIDDGTDLLLAVGSGVLNDITKFVGRRTGLPEILVATAPSMDGFVSNTSALTLGNMKSSVPCDLPRVILGDIEILKLAPKPMILAGLGDMIGKYSALTDWQLSRLINGEYWRILL